MCSKALNNNRDGKSKSQFQTKRKSFRDLTTNPIVKQSTQTVIQDN